MEISVEMIRGERQFGKFLLAYHTPLTIQGQLAGRAIVGLQLINDIAVTMQDVYIQRYFK